MKPEIKITADGSHTLYISKLDEPYHSVNGAITESEHVFIKNAFLHRSKKASVVFEVGFGTGLNCFLTAIKAIEGDYQVFYIGIEKFPLENEIIEQLNFPSILGNNYEGLWDKIHNSEWNKTVKIHDNFQLLKIKDGLEKFISRPKTDYIFDVVYFDAFAPEVQPELWQPGIFQQIFDRCNDKAVLTTYSAKGQVRRNLIHSGFKVEKLPGPPGKKEMLRGLKAE